MTDSAIREISFSQAIYEAMALAMEADERVILMGEDIGVYGGAFQVTGDLVHRFGPERVIDTPISELGGAGVAVGAALTGAAQHSQSLEAWFAHVPGLKVIEPTTPYDAKGMLLAALEQNDPVLIFEHKLLYKMKGHVPEGHYTVPIGPSETRRQGKDVTIVATAIMVARALEAAVILEGENIDVEVIDLRTLRPMDTESIIASVKRTSRLLCVYEGVKTLGIGAEISAAIVESDAFGFLDAPVIRLGGQECPIPYSPGLERASVPQVDDIVRCARDLVRRKI